MGLREEGGVELLRFGGYRVLAGVGFSVRRGFSLGLSSFFALGCLLVPALLLAPLDAVVAGTASGWCMTRGSRAEFWT